MLSLPIYCQWTSTNLQFGGISCSANSYYEKNVATGAVRCIDDEIPFDIPKGWEWCRLGYIIDFSKQTSVRNEDITPDEWLLDLEDIEKDSGIILRKKTMSEASAKSDKHKFSRGNVLYSKLRPYLNKVVIADDDGVCTSEILVFDFGQIDGRYAQTYLMSPFFVDYAMSDAYGVKMPRLGSKQGNNALFPIPPLREQSRIVSRIDSITSHIRIFGKYEQSIKNLNSTIKERLHKSVLQEAIQGRLVPQIESEGTADELLDEIRSEKQRLVKEGKLKKSALTNENRIFRGDDNKYYEQIGSDSVDIDEEIPWIVPSNWSWCRLGEIVEMSMGKTPPRGEQKFWSNGVYPWVSIADLRDGEVITTTKEKVSEEAYHSVFSENISHAGNIVMSFKLTIGKISILGIDAFHNEAIVTISPYHKSHIFKDYLIRVLPYLSQLGNSKDAIKGKTLNSKSLYNIWIPLPPQSEMNRIITKIKEVDQFL